MSNRVLYLSNSSYDAAEDAIDLSKSDVTSSWDDLIRKTARNVKPWGNCRDKDQPSPQQAAENSAE